MSIRRNYRQFNRQGFTILESVIAIMLLSVAAAMVFTVTFPAVNQAYQNRNKSVSRQYADQLLNEILQLPLVTTALPVGVAVSPGPFQRRDQFLSIEDFDGYASHACFPDGTSYSSIYVGSEIATLDSICYAVKIDLVDSNFLTGGSDDFARITITAFLDPDQQRSIGSRQPLISITHLIAR